jgi:hypothetical protein
MGWNRKLWGIELTGGMQGKPVLIGTGWMHPAPRPQYCDEPTRAILFNTRAIARNWCKERMDEYAGREDFCGLWKFRPVRVIETVIKVSNVELTSPPTVTDDRSKTL